MKKAEFGRPVNEWTDQEVFDFVVNHLRTQGKASWTLEQGCMYRGPDDTMCAVGCLIPDELYDPMIETSTIFTLYEKATRGDYYTNIVEWLGNSTRQKLLTVLQGCHDIAGEGDLGKAPDLTDIETRFQSVAQLMGYDLTYTPPVEQFEKDNIRDAAAGPTPLLEP